MQKHLKFITVLLVLIGISFVWGCGGVTGEGKIAMGKGTYTGQLVNGVANGFGILEDPNGNRYEGEWKAGKAHGQGKYTHANGESYEGELKAGLYH